MKEQINLEDFLKDAINAYELDASDFKKEVRFTHTCPKCKTTYGEDKKFCSNDGEKIVQETYMVLPDESKRNIHIFFCEFEGGGNEVNESFPYEFIDSVERRGDGDGYYNYFIFERKFDGKFFYYCSYDGRIESKSLYETKKIVKTTWDF